MGKAKAIKKIVKAMTKLEKSDVGHSDRCMIEMDPEYYGPCTCGANKAIKANDSAIALLGEALEELLGK